MLAQNPTMQLQPWGSIEGTYSSGGQPAADREFLLQYAQGSPGRSDVSFDFTSFKVSTDKEGRFVFPQVPPGTFKLVRAVPIKMGTGQGGWSHDPLQDVTVHPGETATVTVGGSGYTVTAHLRWPADLNPGSSSHIMATINTPIPASLAAILKNPEAAAEWRKTPEFHEFSRNARHFMAAVGDDGILTAENVPPGEYDLTVNAMLGVGGSDKQAGSANGSVKLSVPAEPPNGSLDAGEILMRKADPK